MQGERDSSHNVAAGFGLLQIGEFGGAVECGLVEQLVRGREKEMTTTGQWPGLDSC